MKRIRFFSLVMLCGAMVTHSCSSEIDVNDSEGWIISQNGAFSLRSGELSLSDCYPSIDGESIHPLQYSIRRSEEGGKIIYHLDEGRLTLVLGTDSMGYFISSALEGFETAPDWILPLASGLEKGADRFYKQGFGFGGASGVYPIPEPRMRIESARLKENVWSYDSYLFTGLISPSEHVMVISAYDHHDFQHRSTIYNRQHRIGLIDRHMDTDQVFVESGFAMERIPLEGNRVDLPVIHIATGHGAYRMLNRTAEAVARANHVGLLKAPRYYYCSWYEYQKNFSLDILTEMLEELPVLDPDPNIQAIQIDDGYSWYGDWLNANERWPGGMQEAAKRISGAGYSPGVWVAPFMVSSNSFIYKEQQDWILKDTTGAMMLEWQKPDEDVYMLDASHPDAFEYIRTVFRSLHEMGFTTYKTDFMDWGLQDSRKVQRFAPGKTSVQYFTEVVEMIREEIGEESYWLGCISPFQQMIGFVDGIRVSNDVHYNWSREGVGNMFREMYADQFFNNVFWQNDPDVLYLRDYTMELTPAERKTIALYDGIMGGVINTSCRFHTIGQEQLELWHFLEPGTEHHVAKLPDWGVYDDFLKVMRYYEDQGTASLYLANTSDQEIIKTVNLRDLTGWEAVYSFTWGPGIAEPNGLANAYRARLAPHESILLYLSANGTPPPEGMGLNSR